MRRFFRRITFRIPGGNTYGRASFLASPDYGVARPVKPAGGGKTMRALQAFLRL